MKKIVIAGVLGLILAAVWYYIRNPLGVKVEIGKNTFFVDTAVTSSEKELGLGYRDSMKTDHGMLFLYDNAQQYSYWMKGMRFPLDIIWIKDKTIVDITKNIQVSTDGILPTYAPISPADKVLEINAGLADKLGIFTGESVKIHL